MRSQPLLALPLALTALLGACSREPAGPRPDVLLITLDTTRADFLGAYGAPEGASPHLDALAAGGTVFEQAISTAAVTPVAHAAFLTGLQNWEHGLRAIAAPGGDKLPARVPTIATILKAAGYRTAAIQSAFPVSSHFGLDSGFGHFDDLDATLDQGEHGHGWDVVRFQRRSDETTDLAIELLAQAGDAPTLLWLHYWDPHDAGRVPPEEHLPEKLPRTPDGQVVSTRLLYGAEVTYMDLQIGRLLEHLRASARLDDTLVIVIADHGEGLGDHGWYHHRVLYQEQLRVPLIVHLPRGARPAEQVARVASVVSGVDVLPTVLDALDLEPPRPLSGRSLLPLVAGEPAPRRVVFADALNGYDLNAAMLRERPYDDFVYAAHDGRFKLVYRAAHPHLSELFDLERDPRELENLYLRMPDQSRRLLGELARTDAWVEKPFAAGEGADEAAQQALAALGYTGDGSGVEGVEWAWTCPRHPDAQRAERAPCPVDRDPPVLIARSAALFGP